MTTLLTKEQLPPPLCGYTDRHLRRMAEEGKIPTPRRLGRARVWIKAEVEEMVLTLPRAERTAGHSGSFTSDSARSAVNERWRRHRERIDRRADGPEAA